MRSVPLRSQSCYIIYIVVVRKSMKHDNITASQRVRQWFDHAGQYELMTKNHIHDGPNPLSKAGGFAEECEENGLQQTSN